MKTEREIRSITEAYSIQPATFYVGMYHDHITNVIVTKIVEEDILITGDPYEYYCGYDKDGNRLFEFKKGTVNVMYK